VHLDSVRLTYKIQAIRRYKNSELYSPITSKLLIRELVCYIKGLIFKWLYKRILGIIEAEQVGLLLVRPAQLAHVELGAVVILSIRLAIRGSATLMQFRGVSYKLALIAV